MRIYATRRECEIILSCLYYKMGTLNIDEMPEYNRLTNRIIKVVDNQCSNDRSTYNELKEESK